MTLFTKDRFSYCHVRLSKIRDEEKLGQLINILRHFRICHEAVDIDCIYEFGELGINSSNYLVSTRNGKLVLKKSNNSSETLLDFYCHFSNKLKDHLAVFPFFHKTFLNKFYHTSDNHLYCLLDYIEGEYFDGSMSQLKEVANLVHSINEYCTSISLPECVPARTHDLVNMNKVIQDFLKTKSNRSFLTQNQELIISENLDDFHRVCDLISGTNSMLFGKEQLVHIDLHPHNILFKDMMLTGILDIDSFKLGQPCIAYGFAAYKLYRQSVAHNRSIEQDYSISKFIAQMQTGWNIELLLKGALVEVLTRASIILEPLMDGRMSPWLSVLEIQLMGTLEVLYFLDSINE